MWHLPSSVKICLCKEPTDMRKSFDGLAVMVEHILCQNPLSGYVFIFRNKRGNLIKCLYWDSLSLLTNTDELLKVFGDHILHSASVNRVLVISRQEHVEPHYQVMKRIDWGICIINLFLW